MPEESKLRIETLLLVPGNCRGNLDHFFGVGENRNCVFGRKLAEPSDKFRVGFFFKGTRTPFVIAVANVIIHFSRYDPDDTSTNRYDSFSSPRSLDPLSVPAPRRRRRGPGVPVARHPSPENP